MSHEKNQIWIDQVLDGSLRLLDICNIAKDALLQAKESIQEIQSTIHIRRGSATKLSSEVKKFFASRKMVKKASHKAIRDLKSIEINSIRKDNDTIAIVGMLSDIHGITMPVSEFLLSSFLEPKSQSMSSIWSFISRIKHTNRIEEESQVNEFAKIDAALHMFISPTINKSDSLIVENAQNELENLEFSIQDLEALEKLFGHFMRTRLLLLYILNH